MSDTPLAIDGINLRRVKELEARLAETETALLDKIAEQGAWLAEAHASLAEGDKRYAAENARLAARLAEAEVALERLLDATNDSDGCQYGTLSTDFVRQQCRHGLRLTDSADGAT